LPRDGARIGSHTTGAWVRCSAFAIAFAIAGELVADEVRIARLHVDDAGRVLHGQRGDDADRARAERRDHADVGDQAGAAGRIEPRAHEHVGSARIGCAAIRCHPSNAARPVTS
jgi:hypothetical protein